MAEPTAALPKISVVVPSSTGGGVRSAPRRGDPRARLPARAPPDVHRRQPLHRRHPQGPGRLSGDGCSRRRRRRARTPRATSASATDGGHRRVHRRRLRPGAELAARHRERHRARRRRRHRGKPSRPSAPTRRSSATRRAAPSAPTAPIHHKVLPFRADGQRAYKREVFERIGLFDPTLIYGATSTSPGACSRAPGSASSTRRSPSSWHRHRTTYRGSSAVREERDRQLPPVARYRHYETYPQLRTFLYLSRELLRSGLRSAFPLRDEGNQRARRGPLRGRGLGMAPLAGRGRHPAAAGAAVPRLAE
jgi:hypothetical protein